MPLKIGDWTANIDGIETTLHFESAQNGEVTGTLVREGLSPVTFLGTWDEIAHRVTFIAEHLPETGGNDPKLREYYEGYLSRTPRSPPAGQDVVWFLAGFVQSNGRIAALTHAPNERRSRFPWYAQINEVA